MKKIIICMLIALLLVPSCKSEEEKAIDTSRKMYEDVIDGLYDIIKDGGITGNDKDDVDEVVAAFSNAVKNATSEDEVDEIGTETAGTLLLISLFYTDEDTLNEFMEETVRKYPELEDFLF